MGQLAALVARVGGAAEIYMSEANRVRREQASKLGVTAVFDPAECDVVAEILERTSRLGVDCALDCAGTQPTLDACVGATRPAGIVGVIAIHVGHRTIVPEAWTWKDLTVAGIWSFNFYDAPRILRQIGNGTLPVERVITSRIALADVVRSGLERLADPEGTDVKILIAP
jgi:(R,R)-butanediol dehydrogenase/meso-butanediol dehydrogenase/diacetyl reductase